MLSDLAVQQYLAEMAQDYAGEPVPVSPKLKQDLAKANFDVAQIASIASPAEIDYLETIASDEYKSLVAKLGRFTGTPVTRGNANRLLMQAMSAVQQITQIEQAHKEQLEGLVIEAIRQLPEFKTFTDAYDNGSITVDFQWIPITGLPPKPKQAEPELTPDQSMNLEVFNALNNVDDERMKRKVANYITQGSSVTNTFAFEMVANELNAIDPRLINLYGMLMSVAFLGYWMQYGSVNYASGGAGQIGEESVSEETATITVKGVCFPVMLHELIKGIFDFISSRSMSGDDTVRQQTMKDEHVSDEEAQLILGPAIYKAFRSKIKEEDRALTLQILHKLLTLGDDAADSFKDIMQEMLTTNQSVKFMRMVNELKNEIEDHKQATTGYQDAEPEPTVGGANDGADDFTEDDDFDLSNY